MKRFAPFSVLLLLLVPELASVADQPNILVVWGDDVGQSNISAYTREAHSGLTRRAERVVR